MVNARMTFVLTSGTNEDDHWHSDYDEWSGKGTSSPSHELDENGANTVTGEAERNAGDSDFYPVMNDGEGAEDEGMHGTVLLCCSRAPLTLADPDFCDFGKGARDDDIGSALVQPFRIPVFY